jgi:hypothetical protein
LPRMTGFDVIAPKPVALPARRRKRQRTSSCGIVRASSLVAVAARWLALLPFAVVQDPLAAWDPHPAAAPTKRNAATSAATVRASPGEGLPRRSRCSATGSKGLRAAETRDSRLRRPYRSHRSRRRLRRFRSSFPAVCRPGNRWRSYRSASWSSSHPSKWWWCRSSCGWWW